MKDQKVERLSGLLFFGGVNVGRDKDNLIYGANGRLQNCPSNKEKVGYFGTCWHFHWYRKVFKRLIDDLIRFTPDIILAAINLFLAVVSILLLPILPFVAGFLDWRRSVKEVKRERRVREG